MQFNPTMAIKSLLTIASILGLACVAALPEVYISSDDPFEVVTTHGSTTATFEAEPDGEGFGWSQDFYRDTSAYVQFENGDAVVITLGDEL